MTRLCSHTQLRGKDKLPVKATKTNKQFLNGKLNLKQSLNSPIQHIINKFVYVNYDENEKMIAFFLPKHTHTHT